MALDYEAFIRRFPEFIETDRPLVDEKLAESLLEIDAAVWRTQADLGQGYRAAELLALTPFGRAARMVQKDGSTTYGTIYAGMVQRVAFGFRVI